MLLLYNKVHVQYCSHIDTIDSLLAINRVSGGCVCKSNYSLADDDESSPTMGGREGDY